MGAARTDFLKDPAMTELPEESAGASTTGGRGGRSGGGRAALVYGLIGVMTVGVVHATLGGGGAPPVDASVAQATAKAAVATQNESPLESRSPAVATELAAPTGDTLVVSAAPRRMVRVAIRDNKEAATNPLLRRSRPVSSELLAAAAEQAADDTDVLALPGRLAPGEISPYVGHGRLYGAPGGSRIVYLIDASGSQVDTLPFVQQAVQKALRTLRPEQSYTVIFFNGKAVTEAAPVGMNAATPAAVTETDRFIDPQAGRIVAAGRADARGAIRRALAYQPDTVVLLSDGLTGRRDPLGDRAGLLALIDTANVSGARFHTLQVRQPDPLATPQRRGTLELIASRTGGVYRFVSDANLPIR